MDERLEMEVINNLLFSNEAAEYLGITMQRLNQLVHDRKLIPVKKSKSAMLFRKSDLEKRKIANFSNQNEEVSKSGKFNVDDKFVRDAILYYTVQQYFNNNDKKTIRFLEQIKETYSFSYHSKLEKNIPLLSSLLNVSKNDFYKMYTMVKKSFSNLTDDVILIKKGDSTYPKILEETEIAPPYLFLKGNIHLLNEKSVCVVGSRNASNESMIKTERIVKSLIQRNLVVNAGLAHGIDTATHISALKNGGKTIAVIGTPINQYYPKENKELQNEIAKKGLVVSQFPPCNKIYRWNFPLRNGTMSGISLATIIMEAGETSGALKQADYALKQGRDVLIPQAAIDNPLIKWPKKYIEKGAFSFSTLRQVLEILNKNSVLKNIFTETDMEGVIDVEMD